VSNLEATERAALCDLLDRLGPDQPTLCEGWQTRDLAAHLVLRESRLDAAVGIVVHKLSPWTARVQDSLAGGDFRRLVNRLRQGPPVWSPLRLPKVREGASNVELFVHHEDVRRAQPDWQPRVLDSATDNLLWQRCRRIARMVLRSTSGGIELVRADSGERHVARAANPGQSTLTLTGTPQELLLYLFGRRDHARVQSTETAAG
jgi:uncharacterized protein (TIGR03085 family)